MNFLNQKKAEILKTTASLSSSGFSYPWKEKGVVLFLAF